MYFLGFLGKLRESVPQDHAEVAAELFRKDTDQGNPSAQVTLGRMYSPGEGRRQDHTVAARWFRKVAEQRNPRGQFHLAHKYQNGEGLPRDHTEAAAWFRKAVEQGNPRVEFELAKMHHYDVHEDPAETAERCLKVAKKGDCYAQFAVGVMYYDGKGVPQDHEKAAAWFRKAAEQRNRVQPYNPRRL